MQIVYEFNGTEESCDLKLLYRVIIRYSAVNPCLSIFTDTNNSMEHIYELRLCFSKRIC